MKQYRRNTYYEAAFTTLLIVNALLLLYFITKLQDIENLAKQTQAKAYELLIEVQKGK